MKKFLKIAGISLLSIIILLYISFLFVLPKAIDLNKYKADIQKIVEEQSKLSLDYENMQIITTPYLAIGVNIDKLSINLPDKSLLFSADGIKAAISLPKLLFFTVKVPLLNVDKPFINAEIMENGEDYKVVKLIEDIINEKKESTFGQNNLNTETSSFNTDLIKIILPKVRLNNYKILVTDNATKHYLDFYGDKLVLGYFNNERIKIKTNAELYSDENKNVSLNVDINTFLPEPAPKPDEEDDPAEKVDFAFINPVTTYQNYDLKANIDGKLKINRNKHGKISSFGHFNVEDLTMKISTVQLPKSCFRLKTFATMIDTDTDLYTHKDENIKIKGKLKYGNHPKANISLKSDKIKFENLLSLSKAVLDSMQIQNELGQYKADGTFIADCSVKTNFKRVISDGFIKIENGGLSVRNLGQILSKMNINLVFADNIPEIKNSELYIGGSLVTINGLIDKKSNTDIKVITENVPLPLLFNAFAPKQLRNHYTFKSGNLSSTFTLKGKMKEAVANAVIELSNFNFSEKQNSFSLANKSFNSNMVFESKKQKLAGDIKNDDFVITFPKTASGIKIPEISAKIEDKNLDLNQNIIYFNDKSALMYSGKVINYEKLESVDFRVKGELNTNDIIKFIGQELKPFINSKGFLPVEVTFTGNSKKLTLLAKLLADSNNYFTPIDFKMLQNLKTLLQAKVDFKPNRIKIKDTGLFTRASIFDENGEETVITNKIIGVDGTIEEDTVNLLKIDIPKTLEGKIFVFPTSEFKLENSDLFVYGKIVSPLIRGLIKIKDIKIPEISTNVNDIDLNFRSNELHFGLNNVLLGSSDINIKGILSLIPDKSAKISDFMINSNNFKVEDAASVSEKALSYMPQTQASTSNAQDIPVAINNGSVDMKKITTGDIELLNTRSNLTLFKNVLTIKNLMTDIFKGKTKGNIYINLQNLLVKTDLKGSNINVEKALLDSSGMKDSLSGTVEYSAKLLVDAGAQTEEAMMKGISGDVDFNIKDGQFGPFGKLENLILAENIRESQFFQTALGGIINSLATIDTTHFSELKGHISLKDGICNINPITSQGNVMNLHILGNFDIIKNYADMKVRVKLTSVISNLLGPLNVINPVNLINGAASMNVVTAKAFSLFCETVSEEEMSIMPKFSNAYVDNSATKFQLGVRGDVAKPLTLIKSFKWLATQLQFNAAKEFAESLPEPIEGNENATIEETIEQVEAIEAEKKTLKYKIKHFFKKDDIKKEVFEEN